MLESYIFELLSLGYKNIINTFKWRMNFCYEKVPVSVLTHFLSLFILLNE